MNIRNIIVQAGGKGSRMQSLTKNKPKALVPIDNLPMIFHLFRKYPDKKFTIIGDYKYDVLEKYLKVFADVDYKLIRATGNEGTCAGLKGALENIEDDSPFLLIWCDLILPADYEFPEAENNYIGIAKDFPCRWSWREGEFIEEKSEEHGVAGFFIFKDKSSLKDIPQSGEFVRWLKDTHTDFTEEPLYKTREYGLKSEWDKLPKSKCRPFNSIEKCEDKLIKRPLDAQGEELAERERAWYKKIEEANTTGADKVNIPHIYSYDPLTMEYINGKNIYEYSYVSLKDKSFLLKNIVDAIKNIHAIGKMNPNAKSFHEAYIGKTKKRLEKVKKLIPFAEDEYININGKKCRNIFFNWESLEKEIDKFMPDDFVFIHGDCTFSNMMLAKDEKPILIDPRGYFGDTLLYGDAAYDWAKLYYSLVSNYDQFNLKRFSLDIEDDRVEIFVESNHWEDMEDTFFKLLEGEVSRKQMKLYLAVLWLSLTTYAWEDYDSICGAFYRGIYYFEEAMLMSEEGTADKYFGDTLRIISESLKNLDIGQFEKMLDCTQRTLERGNKIIASGLGKNVPICEKFVGTMLSLGLDANFMHTNTAVHGDLGMVKSGDMVIILSKSGNTQESVYLAELLKERNISLWGLTFKKDSGVEKVIGEKNCLVVNMRHEGDPWDIVPNNSTTLNLIILQGIAMSLALRKGLDLEKDFKPNHPGGDIGRKLR